jgi:hypothetical protein
MPIAEEPFHGGAARARDDQDAGSGAAPSWTRGPSRDSCTRPLCRGTRAVEPGPTLSQCQIGATFGAGVVPSGHLTR